MQQHLTILLICFFTVYQMNSQSNSTPTTTYYLIRHAEKERTDVKNLNPDLNEIGFQRAQKWKNIFQFIDFQLIYSTNFLRTIKTVAPISASKNIEIAIYNPTKIDFEQFKKETLGKNVLIVGHSNTIPQFVNTLIHQEKYREMADEQFSYLYIITIKGNHITDLLLTID